MIVVTCRKLLVVDALVRSCIVSVTGCEVGSMSRAEGCGPTLGGGAG